ncbi:proteasome lid subunit RPN8/RPN11 [Paenibacillus xylanexedens]|uniref:M67 family metallopeptidase n=1 Tax=Paenibacillus xylanexedens TaxID=528191 RepID=UPI00209D9CF8|nr:M67 family metallopeptidase [Paenibacillus xylanexedens]MCP1425948.1 proteasome lid subunit RPN8/RPN11 [Paenibacillus xylanexedens]
MAALHGQQNAFYIPSSVEQEMSKHMFLSLPQEACGVMLGETAAGGIRISRFQPIRNVAPDPLHHFTLDDAEWIRCVFSEPKLIGIFHSHPHTRPVPSLEDIQALPAFAGLLEMYLIGSPDLTAGLVSHMHLNGYLIESSKESQDPAQHVVPSYNLLPVPLCVT